MWNWGNIDWAATAAWVQAILSALAVWAAAALQDRVLRGRDAQQRHERLEGVAAVARFVHSHIEAITRRFGNGMDPGAILDAYKSLDLSAVQRAMKAVQPSELGDVDLIGYQMTLENCVNQVEAVLYEVRQKAERLQGSSTAVNAASMLGNHATELFNAAANVERRVADLVGRNPRL